SNSTSLPPHTYTAPGTFYVKVFGINEVSPRLVPGGCYGKPPARPLAAHGLGEISVTPSPASALQAVTITVDGLGGCGIMLGFGDASAPVRVMEKFPLQITHTYLHSGTYAVSAWIVDGSPCSRHLSMASLKVTNPTVVRAPCTLEPPVIREVTGPYGKNVIGPDDVVQVTGERLGDTAGQVHVVWGSQLGSFWFSQFTEWRKDLFRVRIPHTTGVFDQAVRMEVVIPPGCTSNSLGLKFRALREERLLPGHMVRLMRCSDEARSNDCSASTDMDGISVRAWHHGFLSTGAEDFDEYRIDPLKNGWVIRRYEWTVRDHTSDPPGGFVAGATKIDSLTVRWKYPAGTDPSSQYKLQIYIEGPAGVPFE